MTRQSVRRPSVLRLERLEPRDAPATLVSPTKVTYQDADGDNVTVIFSKPILNPVNASNVFAFDTGTVDGNNLAKQQLRSINLTAIGAPAARTSITLAAVRSPANGGDGFAAVGQIDATGIDLGAVIIDGDLGRILAGDATTATSGVTGLTVQSMGRFFTSTGAPDLNTVIQGKLDFLRVKTDVKEAFINVQGGVDGDIGPVTISGSLLGGDGNVSGTISAAGALGPVRIAGNVAGGNGEGSGSIFSNTTPASVTIGGSLQGGGGTFSGEIASNGALGAVRIGGDLVAGSGAQSGFIIALDKLAGVTIGGSLRGGEIFSVGALGAVQIAGNVSGDIRTNSTLASVAIGGSLLGGADALSGRISSDGAMGTVRIVGNVQGGGGNNSGEISSSSTLTSVAIGGSLIGGAGTQSGRIASTGDAGTIVIGRNVVGGSAAGITDLAESGFVHAKRIASLTIGGSLIAGTDNTTGFFASNGAIQVNDDLGAVLIKGSIIGNATNPAAIFARGSATPTATTDVAIGSLRVLGRVEFGKILAGVLSGEIAVNADAQIGSVFVGGDWVASSIAAGAIPGPDGFYGNGDDAKMSGMGIKDDSLVFSKIASVTISGQVIGTVGGSDHFGIVAEIVGAVKVGGTPLPLTAGKSNDDVAVGITGDFEVNEV